MARLGQATRTIQRTDDPVRVCHHLRLRSDLWASKREELEQQPVRVLGSWLFGVMERPGTTRRKHKRNKLRARYRAEGEAGLEPRSRRPHRSPARVADRHEEAIVALRKELTEVGFDAGAATIHHHLSRRGDQVPSVSPIWRILKARGFVVAQPHKRPRSSWRPFEAEFPNRCRQADVTHVALVDGTSVEVLNVVDDHSRLCVE